MSRVNPGVGETRAKIPLPASMFSNDDLPTFERPMNANSGNDSSGHESRSGALQSKMADEMFTMKKLFVIVASNALCRYNQFSKHWLSPINPWKILADQLFQFDNLGDNCAASSLCATLAFSDAEKSGVAHRDEAAQ